MNLKPKTVGRLLAGTTLLGTLALIVTLPQSARPVNSITSIGNPPRTLSANDYLRTFPEASQLAGAERVDKYEIAGATKCLVVIRKNHLDRGLAHEKNLLEQGVLYSHEEKLKRRAFYEHINTVESNAYRILEQLSKNASISVGQDGVSANDIRTPATAWEISIRQLRMLSQLGYADPGVIHSYETQQTTGRVASAEEQAAYETVRYLPGAAKTLHAERKINCFGVEDPSLNARLERTPASELMTALRETIDDREDYAIELLATRPEPIVYVEYGGAHSFGGPESCGPVYPIKGRVSKRDNIAAWNTAHPNKRFSLIEVTPREYTEWDGQ